MIFLSFVFRYAFENFLVLTITIALETLDLFFDKHSRFKNKRTDLFFAFSIIITFITILAWIIVLILLYIWIDRMNNNSPMNTLIKDLKHKRRSLMTFYTCFFFVRIFVTLLMFVSKQNNEFLTVPFWGAIFVICLLF